MTGLSEKDALLESFYDVAPFLRNVENFGWWHRDGETVYHIGPSANDVNDGGIPFRPFSIDIAAGTHSEIRYRDNNKTIIIAPTDE